jgi:hypothetical protein
MRVYCRVFAINEKEVTASGNLPTYKNTIPYGNNVTAQR